MHCCSWDSCCSGQICVQTLRILRLMMFTNHCVHCALNRIKSIVYALTNVQTLLVKIPYQMRSLLLAATPRPVRYTLSSALAACRSANVAHNKALISMESPNSSTPHGIKCCPANSHPRTKRYPDHQNVFVERVLGTGLRAPCESLDSRSSGETEAFIMQ